MSSTPARIFSLRGITLGAQVGIAALLGDKSARERLINRVVHSRHISPYVWWPRPETTAASPASTTTAVEPVVVAARDWREHFVTMLSGNGLEIGPLHMPLPKPPNAQVVYVDRLPLAQLLEHYPELPPADLIDPNIIDDAETLRTIPDDTYDFVSAAHVIEHMRNPIAALENWCRVLKPGGLLYVIVPDKRTTFDATRPPTSLEHMMRDYYTPSRERDREHFLEYAVEVDKKTAQQALAGAEHLEGRDYSIHFHVFLPSDVLKLLAWFSDNIRPLDVLEGPVMAPGSIEFHLMLRKRS
ncbi:MAG: methyltransferase domain-containing protein [Candidatus Binatia bacterium]